MITINLEQMIIKKLGLYSGIRSRTEDEVLHNEAYDRLFIETLTFLKENNARDLMEEHENSQKNAKDLLASIIVKLQSIPNWEQKLLIRLSYYLDNWIITGK